MNQLKTWMKWYETRCIGKFLNAHRSSYGLESSTSWRSVYCSESSETIWKTWYIFLKNQIYEATHSMIRFNMWIYCVLKCLWINFIWIKKHTHCFCFVTFDWCSFNLSWNNNRKVLFYIHLFKEKRTRTKQENIVYLSIFFAAKINKQFCYRVS